MRLTAFAKINWTLDIMGRLPNGYHEMDMLMQPISLYDTLTIDPADTLSLQITGDIPLAPDENNLCLKAARALGRYLKSPMGARICLEKHIPMGAGMGGGSADAAATLMGLNRLWNLNLSIGQLADTALLIGADVPFFLYGGLARAQGVGEKLTLYPCDKTYPLIILKPECTLSTQKVFAQFSLEHRVNRPNNDAALKALQTGDLMLLRASLGNVLTPVSGTLCPDIAQALAALTRHGAAAAFMTGSGSAVVGVYKGPEARDNALTALEKLFPCYPARTRQKAVEMSL